MGNRWIRPFLAITLLVVCFANGVTASAQPQKTPNIVLITLDTMRADRAGFLGGHAGLTPNLDRLAAASMVFGQAYAQTPLTISSTATLLTGTYPQTNRASALGVLLPRGVPYLPEQLHAHGYRTAAFIDSPELDPIHGPFQGYDQGFDSYSTGLQSERGAAAQTDVRGVKVTVSRAANWLPKGAAQPFFLWVHLSPAPASSPIGYDKGIAATDQAVGQFIAALKLKGIYDDSVVVVASVHGESLGDHGEQMSGMFLYDETIHVPLLLKLPGNGSSAARLVKGRVRLLDVSPTLLEIAGIAVPSAMQGQSLLRIAGLGSQVDLPAYARSQLPPEGFACSTIESWRSGKYLYIHSARPEFYDLSADPGADHNLAASAPAKIQVLAAQLAAFDRRLAGNATSSEAGLTLSETQKLASLGYVGLTSHTGTVAPKPTGIDPKDAIGAANKILLGLVALDEGKTEPAIEQFRAVLSQRQNIYLAQYGMGVALARQQQYAQSVGFLRRAINLQPESAFAHYAMGMSLVKAGDLKTAAVHLEIAARLLPSFSGLHAQLAQVHQRLGMSKHSAQP
jgi:arylsulfatase A-like enzyme